MKQPAVISTRVLLNRNYPDLPFELQTNYNMSGISIARTIYVLEQAGMADEMDVYRLNALSWERQQQLVQQQVITPHLLSFPQNAAVALKEAEGVSIMINERDHLVIQVKAYTDDVQQVAYKAFQLAAAIEEHAKFAYDPDFGYLTARVDESGLAMRGMMTLHLPLLRNRQELSKVQEKLPGLGVELTPLVVENGEIWGDLYQLSTVVGAFASPEELYQGLYQGAAAVLEVEKSFIQDDQGEFSLIDADERSKALGYLRHALQLHLLDFLHHWSEVRTAALYGRFRHWPSLETIDELLQLVSPARLANLDMKAWLESHGRTLSEADETHLADVDFRRALVTRTLLGGPHEL